VIVADAEVVGALEELRSLARGIYPAILTVTLEHGHGPVGASPRFQGRTDRGIGQELFVTRKTVEAHIRSIFRKLDRPADATENRRVHAVLAFLS
jgi:hypothetical protein